MSDTTPHNQFPLIQPAQAQKHVTHNEALLSLDTLVHMAVFDRDLTSPPSSPNEGDRYLIALEAAGDWANHRDEIAVWQSARWAFHIPNAGWVCWVEDEKVFINYDGSNWGIMDVTPPAPLSELGINTEADTSNRLAVASDAVLMTHAGSDIQTKLNKASDTDTASFLFQSAWTGHAEIGLTGDNDFHFKVSSDGNSFYEGLIIDRNSGDVSFPNQKTFRQLIPYSGRWYCYNDKRWVGPANFRTENYSTNLGLGSEPNIDWDAKDLFLKSGTTIKGIKAIYNVNNTQITAIYWKLYFQYGPLDGTWGSTSKTTRVEIDGGTINLQSKIMNYFETTFSTYSCPSDGYLMLVIKPEGTLTATRQLYFSGHVDAILHE